MASIVARDCHRRHFNQYGLLGAATGPVVAMGKTYRLNTDLGFIDVEDFQPSPNITYEIRVQFVGLQINETNETYDEPYIVMGVVTLAPEFTDDLDKLVASQLIKVPGEDHPKDYVFADTQTVWKKGQLIGGTGIKVVVFAYEEDSGDPDEVANAINTYLRDKAQQGAQAIGSAFGAGTEATAVANSPEFQWFLKIISLGLASWIGDDDVGYGSREIPVSQIKSLAAMSEVDYQASLKTGPGGIKYNCEPVTVGDSDHGKYTVYFRVAAAEIPPVKLPDLPTP
jgi:hypothetical protein